MAKKPHKICTILAAITFLQKDNELAETLLRWTKYLAESFLS